MWSSGASERSFLQRKQPDACFARMTKMEHAHDMMRDYCSFFSVLTLTASDRSLFRVFLFFLYLCVASSRIRVAMKQTR